MSRQQFKVEPAPETTVIKNSRTRRMLETLLDERVILDEEIKSREGQKRLVNESIQELMTDAGLDTVQYGRIRSKIYEGSRTTLKKDKLLELGVSARIINQATEVSTYTSVRVTVMDDNEEIEE